MRQQRRVLMSTDAVGGVWNFALELTRGLREHEIAVVLAVMGPPPTDAQRTAAAACGVLALEEAPYRLEWMEDPWVDVTAAGDWLLTLERRWACGLVHLNGYAHASCRFRSPKVTVAHSCVLSWWRSVRGEKAPPQWHRYREAVRAGLAAADAVVAPTRWMAAELARHYGPTAPVSVIHNGRSSDDFAPTKKEPFVFAAGRIWDAAKNLDSLMAVTPALAWPTRIAGPVGVAPGGGAPAASPCGGPQLVGMLSPQAMAETYARASIYAHPARYEPFGLSVLEAALSECALVLGDIPTLRELWDGAALFVDVGDHSGADTSAALQATLGRLIAKPRERERWGRRARQRARRFTQQRMIASYLRLYRRLWGGIAADRSTARPTAAAATSDLPARLPAGTRPAPLPPAHQDLPCAS